MVNARSVASRGRPTLALVSRNSDTGPVVTAAGTVSRVGQQWDEITSGRVSAGMLAALLLGLIGFYVWTHAVQGGG